MPAPICISGNIYIYIYIDLTIFNFSLVFHFYIIYHVVPTRKEKNKKKKKKREKLNPHGKFLLIKSVTQEVNISIQKRYESWKVDDTKIEDMAIDDPSAHPTITKQRYSCFVDCCRRENVSVRSLLFA